MDDFYESQIRFHEKRLKALKQDKKRKDSCKRQLKIGSCIRLFSFDEDLYVVELNQNLFKVENLSQTYSQKLFYVDIGIKFSIKSIKTHSETIGGTHL